MLLIDLTSVKDAGQWCVLGPSQCSPCSCREDLLHHRSNVMRFCLGHFVLVFSSSDQHAGYQLLGSLSK